jgi:hypothetical protein
MDSVYYAELKVKKIRLYPTERFYPPGGTGNRVNSRLPFC